VDKFIKYAKQVPGVAAVGRKLKNVLRKRVLQQEPEIDYPVT
jgi:hypothetical protein